MCLPWCTSVIKRCAQENLPKTYKGEKQQPVTLQNRALKHGLISNKDFSRICSVTFRVLKLRFLAVPGGPVGFRELREAYRNHFHLSLYLLVPGITSYGQKTNKEKQLILTHAFCRVRFPKQLGLDSFLASWDLKIRIPRRKLPIQSYSQG